MYVHIFLHILYVHTYSIYSVYTIYFIYNIYQSTSYKNIHHLFSEGISNTVFLSLRNAVPALHGEREEHWSLSVCHQYILWSAKRYEPWSWEISFIPACAPWPSSTAHKQHSLTCSAGILNFWKFRISTFSFWFFSNTPIIFCCKSNNGNNDLTCFYFYCK